MRIKQHNPNRMTNDHGRSNAAYYGNSTAEYVLVGVLVVVVCILAMQNLSGGLNTAMAMIDGNMQNHKNQATSAQAMHQALASGQVNGLSASQQALLEESMSQKLQTTGANGSTEVLANQIAAAAHLLLSEGKIDQSQYDILMKLANEGHKIAQIEGMVQEAVDMSNGNYTAFTNMNFTINGQTYNAFQLSALIGYDGPIPSDFQSNNILAPGSSILSTAEPEVAAFLNLYNQALASGALADPTAMSTVTSASTQIASIGEVVEDGIFRYELGTVSTPSQIAAANASAASNMNSTAICTTGNFQDNGTLCTK